MDFHNEQLNILWSIQILPREQSKVYHLTVTVHYQNNIQHNTKKNPLLKVLNIKYEMYIFINGEINYLLIYIPLYKK